MSKLMSNYQSVPAVEFRQNLGGFLNRVNLKGENFIIERDGKSLAAVVSIYDLSRIKKLATEDMDNLFNIWSSRQIEDNISENDIDTVVLNEINYVRKKPKYNRKKCLK